MSRDIFKLAKTILITGFGVFISYAINFLLTPYITDNVGIEAYGFVSIAKTAVSYAEIITVALTTFVVRYISISYHKENMQEAGEYYSSSVLGCILLPGVVFAGALPLILNMEHLLKIPVNLVFSVKILFILVFLNFVFTTIITPLSVGSYIKNRLDLLGAVNILSYLCDAAILIILFFNFEPVIWFLGIGSLSASIVKLAGNLVLKNKLTPNLHFKKSFASFKKVCQMMSNGIWQSVNSVGNVLNSGLDLIVSNLMLSGVETGEISVTKTIVIMFSMLYQVVFQPFQPHMLKSYSTGDMDLFIKDTSKAMKICGYFSNAAFAGFVALGPLYYRLWLPSQNTGLLYMLTIVNISISITEGISHPMYYISTLALKKRMPCIITVLGGAANTLGMYFLLKYTNLGPYAIVLTTAVIMTLINLIFTPIYAAYCIHVKVLKFYKVIIPHIISSALMTAVFKAAVGIIKPHSWLTLIFCAFIMAGAGAVIHAVIMDFKGIAGYIRRTFF